MVGGRGGRGEDGRDDAPEEVPHDDLIGPPAADGGGEAGGQE